MVAKHSSGLLSHPLVRRTGRALAAGALIYGVALLVAATALTLLLLALGHNPFDALTNMVDAAVGTGPAFSQTLNKVTPLLLASVAVAFGLRAGYFNLGLDGQLYGGAIAAVFVAYKLPEHPPTWSWIILLLAGLVGGMLVALVPALLRAFAGVNELFTTVMFNFIALYFALYLATGPWNDPISGEPLSKAIPFESALPHFLTVFGHIGIVFAVAVAVIVHVWVTRTRNGFEFRAAGVSPLAARFGGVKVVPIGVMALLVGGAIGGLAGAIEVSGTHQRLIIGFAPNYGLIAVLIAVVARNNILGLIPTAFLFGSLLIGVDSLQRSVGLPSSAVLLIEGLVVITILVMDITVRKSPRLAFLLEPEVEHRV